MDDTNSATYDVLSLEGMGAHARAHDFDDVAETIAQLHAKALGSDGVLTVLQTINDIDTPIPDTAESIFKYGVLIGCNLEHEHPRPADDTDEQTNA